MNCWVPLVAMPGFVGVTVRDTRVAGLMVSEPEPEMLPDTAVIVVDPAATDVAKPLDPATLLIVAAVVFEELQVTEAVKFCVEPSE